MLMHGALVTRTSDNTYDVHDANRRLGGIVRHSETEGRLFRAFGEDFSSLNAAVLEFTKIRGFTPRDV